MASRHRRDADNAQRDDAGDRLRVSQPEHTQAAQEHQGVAGSDDNSDDQRQEKRDAGHHQQNPEYREGDHQDQESEKVVHCLFSIQT